MPRMRNQKQRKTSFTITNDEFLIKLIFARMPALINPRSIHIVEVNTFGKAFAKISYKYIKKLLILVEMK